MKETCRIYEVSKSKLAVDEFALDVKSGLSLPRKCLKSKYFYDKIGSALFEQICVQPEYYISRVETSILKERSVDILSICSEDISLIELGSGSAQKTRILFECILQRQNTLHYFPIDVSHSILLESIKSLSLDYQNLCITGIYSDYANGINKVTDVITGEHHIASRKLILFLGSSIGNFEPKEAISFFQILRDKMERKDLLLVGFDLQKKPAILNSAYNDKAGVTAKFNLNLLSRINRDLEGDFDIKSFDHHAFYNSNQRRVEMHLVSKRDQEAHIKLIGESFEFQEGEPIHTENSYKYSLKQIRKIADDSGFEVKKNFLDQRKWFDLALLSPT
ncbi:MAG TPA: L-histidine N(alpha)-methyltransferase [Nitrososphaeraceae archaeon]|nr:L-histidine N(alpha)-methyltransferase [Nitrososphaeraceae archaeon]